MVKCKWVNRSRSLCAHKEQEENVVLIVCERHDVSLDEWDGTGQI